jgi:polyhydroxybutyrate depolymerase
MKRFVAWGFMIALLVAAGLSRAADSQDSSHNLEFGGLKRSYLLHLPANAPAGPLPLVVMLHGGMGTGASAAQQSGFDAEADMHGFIVVYPDGTDRDRPLRAMMGKQGFLTWNAGSCCGYAQQHDIDDVGFIRAVVADVGKDHPVDPKRIYATGMSNGAMMSYRLACEASDLFAAVGPVAGIVEIPDCKPAHPVAVIDFQGTDDENVPLNGGIGKKEVGKKEDRKPVQYSIDLWVKADGCSVTVKSEHPGIHLANYGGCQDGTAVDYYVVQGGGHDWPGGKQMAAFLDKPNPDIPATDLIWSFFKDHPKP